MARRPPIAATVTAASTAGRSQPSRTLASGAARAAIALADAMSSVMSCVRISTESGDDSAPLLLCSSLLCSKASAVTTASARSMPLAFSKR